MWKVGMSTLMNFSHFRQELWADVKDLPILKRIYYKLNDMVSFAIFLATMMAVAYTHVWIIDGIPTWIEQRIFAASLINWLVGALL